MNYSELLSRVQTYSGNTALTSKIDMFLDLAEAKMYRDIDFKHSRNVKTSSFISGDPFITTPAGCWIIRYFQVISGTTRSFLLLKDLSFINEYWPDRTTTGVPKYYAFLSDTQVMVGPTPTSSLTMECHYTFRPEVMSSTNTSTWIGTNAPDLLFAAVMFEVTSYHKGEMSQANNTPASPGYWEAEYKKAIERIKIELQEAVMKDFYSGSY